MGYLRARYFAARFFESVWLIPEELPQEPVTGGKRRPRVVLLPPGYAPTPRPIGRTRRRQQQYAITLIVA